MGRNVLAAMSGGVDSSVAAVILFKQGFNVTGVTLKLLEDHAFCDETYIDYARQTALRLGMEHFTLNASEDFSDKVLRPFCDAYLKGLTPNPCIFCNRYIKFGILLDKALGLGYDYLATGHYARVEYCTENKRYLLKRPADRIKDQTYFLYGLTQHQLSHILFPLGDLKKSQVREIAEKYNFSNAKNKESQDLCFIKGKKYADFVESHTGQPFDFGDFIGPEGDFMGRHKGIARYTIGQRKGLGLSWNKPLFVTAKDGEKNQIILGEDKDLFSYALLAENCNFISFESILCPIHAKAQIRYGQAEQNALIYPEKDGQVLVEFENPQRAVSPGQAVVFYDNDTVLGGGTIIKSL